MTILVQEDIDTKLVMISCLCGHHLIRPNVQESRVITDKFECFQCRRPRQKTEESFLAIITYVHPLHLHLAFLSFPESYSLSYCKVNQLALASLSSHTVLLAPLGASYRPAGLLPT